MRPATLAVLVILLAAPVGAADRRDEQAFVLDFPPSNVVVEKNELRWDAVLPPRTSYTYDRTKILAIQFHVPAVTTGTARRPYSFGIKNLTSLKE